MLAQLKVAIILKFKETNSLFVENGLLGYSPILSCFTI